MQSLSSPSHSYTTGSPEQYFFCYFYSISISSNSYVPYLILETVEIAKTAGFNNHLSFPEYTFFSILTGYWLNHVQREKGNLISIHDHQLTSSYRDQVYFAGMPWQREAQNHKLPFAWFTPLGTGTSVDGAVKFKY